MAEVQGDGQKSVLGKVRSQVFSLKQFVKILLPGAHKSLKPSQSWSRSPMGRILRSAREDSCLTVLSNMIKRMKMLVDFKRSFVFFFVFLVWGFILFCFFGEVIPTNSMETRWWYLTPSHPWQLREWWPCLVLVLVFQYLSGYISEHSQQTEACRTPMTRMDTFSWANP